MIVTAERVSIPEYDATEASVETMLGSIALQEIPGAVVRAGNEDNARFVLRTLAGLVDSRGGTVKDPLKGRLVVGASDVGWHVDRAPVESELTVHLHRTVKGRSHTELVVPRPGLWAPEREVTALNFPDEITRQLELGEVDDEAFEPTIYASELNPHDILAFTTGGPKPTVHNFATLEAPRRAALYIATIPVESQA